MGKKLRGQPAMPSAAICSCRKSRFREEDGIQRCFYCGKLRTPNNSSPGGEPRRDASPGRARRHKAEKGAAPSPQIDAQAVAREIDAIRKALSIDTEKATVPDRAMKFYFGEEWSKELAAFLDEVVPPVEPHVYEPVPRETEDL